MLLGGIVLTGSLILIIWVVAGLEPYGLRLRQQVMSLYHPEVSRRRSVWLYNRLLRARWSFVRIARKQLRLSSQHWPVIDRWADRSVHLHLFPRPVSEFKNRFGTLLCNACSHFKSTLSRYLKWLSTVSLGGFIRISSLMF